MLDKKITHQIKSKHSHSRQHTKVFVQMIKLLLLQHKCQRNNQTNRPKRC